MRRCPITPACPLPATLELFCLSVQVTGDNLWPLKTYLIQIGLQYKNGSYIAEDKPDDTSLSRRWTASEVRCRTRVPPARRAFGTLILTVCQPGLNVRGQGESRQPSALDPSITCHTPSTAVRGCAILTMFTI